MKDPFAILKYPVSTEKAVRLMETENKLLFIVDIKATKKMVKDAVEQMFKVKVENVHTLITPRYKKKAYVKLAANHPAMDIATQMGLI